MNVAENGIDSVVMAAEAKKLFTDDPNIGCHEVTAPGLAVPRKEVK